MYDGYDGDARASAADLDYARCTLRLIVRALEREPQCRDRQRDISGAIRGVISLIAPAQDTLNSFNDELSDQEEWQINRLLNPSPSEPETGWRFYAPTSKGTVGTTFNAVQVQKYDPEDEPPR